MKGNRPRSVTFVGWFFIAAGTIGFLYHAAEIRTQGTFGYEEAWVLVVRLVAVAGGVFLLRGANGARWLVLGWMAYHVILSTLHSVSEVVVHVAFLGVIAWVLLRPPAARYFREEKS